MKRCGKRERIHKRIKNEPFLGDPFFRFRPSSTWHRRIISSCIQLSVRSAIRLIDGPELPIITPLGCIGGSFLPSITGQSHDPFPTILIRPGFCLSNPTRSFCPCLKCSRKFKKSQARKVLFDCPEICPICPHEHRLFWGRPSSSSSSSSSLPFCSFFPEEEEQARTVLSSRCLSRLLCVLQQIFGNVVVVAICCCFFPRCSPSLNLSFLF